MGLNERLERLERAVPTEDRVRASSVGARDRIARRLDGLAERRRRSGGADAPGPARSVEEIREELRERMAAIRPPGAWRV